MNCYWCTLYVLIQLSMVLLVFSENYYSINAPGVIKSNRKYSVVVSLHEASETCSIRVGLEGPNFNEFKDVSLQPFESKVIDFLPQKLSKAVYKLSTEGLTGLIFKNQSIVHVQSDYGPKIYIQTDKTVYKPQDVVKLRVVILDEHMRPLNITEPVTVEILDNDNNRVKLFSDISLRNGVFTDQFLLSKYPVLGIWKIYVNLGGKYEYSKSKTIKVFNYILPKFSVYLKTPTEVILSDGYIKVVVYGKYTFDKYVEGNATVELWNQYTYELIQTKQVDIETIAFVEFNLKNLSNLNDIHELSVKAKITEKHTGKTVEEEKIINFHKQRYNLEILEDEIEFENNKPYLLKLKVKHWTGAPVLDHKTAVTMEHGSKVYEAFLDNMGLATFEFEHDANSSYKFQYKDSLGMLANIYTNDNLMLNNREYYCRLRLVDKKLHLQKPVLIEVSSILHIPYLMYTIMGHASLIRAEYIKVPPNQKSHIITITPTIEMIPRSFIYVYYVHKGNLRYEEMRLDFPIEFGNQISLSAPKQVRPGEDVTITVSAQPKSYVCILAVDLGVYLMDNSYDLNKNDILQDMYEEVSYTSIAATIYPGIQSGLLTLTNANYIFANNFPAREPIEPPLYHVRKNFLETWIFDNFEINETETKLTLPIPDAITTWRITAFSNNNETGFDIVNSPTDIITIQQFFISTNLPYSVKRGEIVTIPITIFNYSNQTLETEVVLHNNNQEFYFMDSKTEGVIHSNYVQQQIKQISITSEKAQTVKFLIYPLKVGDINLNITASSSSYSDAVLQKLKVEPEGVPKQESQSLYISIPLGENITSTFSIEEPDDSVTDSDYITFSVGGHYLVPTVENFDDLIQMPTGCGEQNMVNFAPSVLILQYLKANENMSQEKSLVESLRSAIEVSYQQQLSFRHENGGYSVFGMGIDDEPSTWLTAYVVRYFIKASLFVDIEEFIIESALVYLARQQKKNGEFTLTGYLINPNHKNTYGQTAFILLAFLENEKYANKYQRFIQNGIEFLNSNLANIKDIYALSLTATAMKRAKHMNANTLINQLKSQVIDKNGLKWWSENDQNVANDIEVTSYSAMALLDTPGDHTSILKWLIEQRNVKGGFKSSSDTVVGMEALVKFSEIYKNIKNANLKISYMAKDGQGNKVASDEFSVNPNNFLDMQKHELPKTTRHITFEMKGNGASLVQLSHQYNIANVEGVHLFNIQPKIMIKNAKEIILEVCFTYQMDFLSLGDITNMIIMEANLPSGFRFAKDNTLLDQNKLLKKIEYKNSESTIILYLDKLEANSNHCLELPADKTNEVLMLKPAAIKMYDYYNLSRSNIEFYSF
ncbi:CD109 antigen-like [Lucilia cuprina]|uniref:CD109 antigen-like n=1 Tax=Lucilia cuprina TaxID=7375 RepID=UPI001F05A0EA|nr:CD109 antigen-like [Lucilia cuprina]